MNYYEAAMEYIDSLPVDFRFKVANGQRLLGVRLELLTGFGKGEELNDQKYQKFWPERGSG